MLLFLFILIVIILFGPQIMQWLLRVGLRHFVNQQTKKFYGDAQQSQQSRRTGTSWNRRSSQRKGKRMGKDVGEYVSFEEEVCERTELSDNASFTASQYKKEEWIVDTPFEEIKDRE